MFREITSVAKSDKVRSAHTVPFQFARIDNGDYRATCVEQVDMRDLVREL